ncbi:MAG: ATP-binding protein [Nocardioides sp.]|uniref:sensor histidine kinase n=1 Tax=Nocardioides sp. TaxID=35761 RepID=UPI003EFE92B7
MSPTRIRVEPGPSRLRSLTDAYPDGVLAADAHGVVVVMNHQAEVLLGVAADDCLGRQVAEVLALQDQDGRTWLEVNDPYRALRIQRGVPEQSWINAAGEEVLTTARLVRDEPLAPLAGVAVALRHGRGRARLDRERSDLVATLAHELRSPLTGVKGFVQALLNRWDKLTDDQRKLMLTTVNADADRLTRLIAELLDVARIDTDRLNLHPREVAAPVLAQRVVDSVTAGSSRPVHLDVEDDLPPMLADPDKFTQVLTNLVENGVRHGAELVRVSLSRIEGASGVRLRVEDGGEGIPEELRRRVFTKFWTSGQSAGTGLGLYIVGGLARAHGATVEVGDSPLGGASVVVDWPGPSGED